MTRRQTLEDFRCPYFMDSVVTCHEDCLSGDCWVRPIYRQAIADHRCARVLLAIKRWWWDKHYWPDIFTGESGDPGAVRVARFRNWMNAALRDAGL